MIGTTVLGRILFLNPERVLSLTLAVTLADISNTSDMRASIEQVLEVTPSLGRKWKQDGNYQGKVNF